MLYDSKVVAGKLHHHKGRAKEGNLHRNDMIDVILPVSGGVSETQNSLPPARRQGPHHYHLHLHILSRSADTSSVDKTHDTCSACLFSWEISKCR